VNVRIGRAKDHAVIADQELVAIEEITHRPNDEIDREQTGKMPDRGPTQVGHGAGLMRDLTAYPINRRDENRRQDENHECPIAQYVIRGQRKKIETQIVTKDGLGAPKRSGMQPLEDNLPIADLRGAHDDTKRHGDAGYEQLPRQSIEGQLEQFG